MLYLSNRICAEIKIYLHVHVHMSRTFVQGRRCLTNYISSIAHGGLQFLENQGNATYISLCFSQCHEKIHTKVICVLMLMNYFYLCKEKKNSIFPLDLNFCFVLNFFFLKRRVEIDLLIQS